MGLGFPNSRPYRNSTLRNHHSRPHRLSHPRLPSQPHHIQVTKLRRSQLQARAKSARNGNSLSPSTENQRDRRHQMASPMDMKLPTLPNSEFLRNRSKPASDLR